MVATVSGHHRRSAAPPGQASTRAGAPRCTASGEGIKEEGEGPWRGHGARELRRPLMAVELDAGATVHGFGYGLDRSEEHTSELQSHYSISYAVFCLKKYHFLMNLS